MITRSGSRRSLHQTSTISQPSRRSIPLRRASRCWAVGVACHSQLWHSTPTLRAGSARSSSARRMPSRVRTGYSSTRRIPALARTRAAIRWNQLRGSRLSIRSPRSIRSAGGPERPRRRHVRATLRSSSVDTPIRSALSRARAVGPMPTAGASRARVLAIDSTWIPSTASTCSSRDRGCSAPRCRSRRWDGRGGCRSRRPLVWRSNPSRRCRRAAAPWETAVTPGLRLAPIARPWKVVGPPARASTPGNGEQTIPCWRRRDSTRGVTPTVRDWLVEATPCWFAMSSNRAFMPRPGRVVAPKGKVPELPRSVRGNRPERAGSRGQNRHHGNYQRFKTATKW